MNTINGNKFQTLESVSIKMSSPALIPCIDENTTLGIDEACFYTLNLYNFPVSFYSIIRQAYWVWSYILLLKLCVIKFMFTVNYL